MMISINYLGIALIVLGTFMICVSCFLLFVQKLFRRLLAYAIFVYEYSKRSPECQEPVFPTVKFLSDHLVKMWVTAEYAGDDLAKYRLLYQRISRINLALVCIAWILITSGLAIIFYEWLGY